MADITFQFPDAPGAEIVIRTSFWRSPAILRDGLPLQRTGRGKTTYLLTLPDGTQRRVRVAGFLNLSVEADGTSYPAERRLRWYEYMLVGIPLVLAVPGITGGALGIGLGIAGVFVNARLARAVARPSLRALSMIGASACLFGIYLAAAVALSLVIHPTTPPSFEAGTCYDGPTSPPAAADAYTQTACTTAHDVEVIGTPVNPASTYPGGPALDAFANAACTNAFKAYVGKPFDATADGMLVFTPTSDSWAQGDRTVVCLAVASEGQKLTGSLKGSAGRSSTPDPSPIAGLPDGWVTYTAPDGSFSRGVPR